MRFQQKMSFYEISYIVTAVTQGTPYLVLYDAINVAILTLNMQEPSYLSLTRSISWLLMP